MWVPMYAAPSRGHPYPGGRISTWAKVRNSFDSEVKATYFGITRHFKAIIYYSFTF